MSLKRFYYDVPACPRCQSQKTGRYVREPGRTDDALYMMKESLKNGELIRFAENIPEKNAFCSDCGYEWACAVPLRLVTAGEQRRKRMERGTDALLAEFLEKHPKKKKSIAGKIFGLLP